ncbi:hypothetical protein VP01_2462g1, partial [Puccinia sorghi]
LDPLKETPPDFPPPPGLEGRLLVLYQRILHRLSTTGEPLVLIMRFNGMTQTISNLMDRTTRGDLTETGTIESYLRIEDRIHDLVSSVDDNTHRLILQFTNHASTQLIRMWDTSRPAELLDSLTTTTAASMTSASPESPSLACTICFEFYLASDIVVVLPCHTTHYFHRACIQTWFASLNNQVPTCPTCRTGVRRAAR